MKMAFGNQGGDAWLKSRIGRITGSKIADVCSYLTRTSGAKKAGAPSADRDKYYWAIIGERLTGRAAESYVSPEMEHGTAYEDEAALYYEGAMRQMVEPVGFVLHPKYDFTGASPDRLVGSEGVLEIKCPATTTHLRYRKAGNIPDEYLPQVAWELACTGRKWADFVSYDPRIQADTLRFFWRRIGREELEWVIGCGDDKKTLTGEAVIDYFTSEVLKFNAEIEYFFAENDVRPVAPYPVEIVAADESAHDDYNPDIPMHEQCAFLDAAELIDTP